MAVKGVDHKLCNVTRGGFQIVTRTTILMEVVGRGEGELNLIIIGVT